MSEVCARARDGSAPGTRERKGCGSTPTSCGTCSIRCRTPSRSTARRVSRAQCATRSRRAATTASSAISSCPRSTCRGGCHARRALHPQRRGRDLAAARRDTAVWLRRRLYRQQWRRMLRFEARTLSAFDRVLAVSDVDRETFHRLYPEAAGADLGDPDWRRYGVLRARHRPHRRRAAHVFTGSMDWLPNVDGVQYFCREILPLHPRSGARRDVHDRRTLADAGGAAARRATRRSR